MTFNKIYEKIQFVANMWCFHIKFFELAISAPNLNENDEFWLLRSCFRVCTCNRKLYNCINVDSDFLNK